MRRLVYEAFPEPQIEWLAWHRRFDYRAAMREISNCIVRVIGLERTDCSGLGIKPPLVDTA